MDKISGFEKRITGHLNENVDSFFSIWCTLRLEPELTFCWFPGFTLGKTKLLVFMFFRPDSTFGTSFRLRRSFVDSLGA